MVKQVHFLAILITASLLAGCLVGPNFHPPARPSVNQYAEKPLPTRTVSTPSAGKAGQSQAFLKNRDIPSEWWTLFHSPKLDYLIKQGLAHNASYSAAYAALAQAQETLNAQIGNSLFPAFNTQVGVQRQRLAGASFGNDLSSSIFNVLNATVNVSYTLDIFGGARRQLESLAAQVDYQQFNLIAAYLTIATNIVTTAVTTASLQAQIKAVKELYTAQNRQLEILKRQLKLGGVSQINVLTQETLVKQTLATIPTLESNLSQAKHALSVLVGEYPDQPLPEISLNELDLPTKLPVSIPSRLVRQRPDVRASEALLHAANAQIGVATANLLPQVVITGSNGWFGATLGDLFNSANRAWNIGVQLTQPIFQGGALFAQRRGAIYARNQAFAQYKQVVLQAFQNVADVLRALEFDAKNLQALRAAEVAARRNLAITSEQYYLGGVSYLNLLVAQQAFQQAQLNYIRAQATRYSDTAALFQALGGGWWHEKWCLNESIEASCYG